MPLNRLNDYLFKWIFGNEGRKATLLDLINAVLTNGSEEDVIVDLEYQDRELDPQRIKDKRANLDIRAKTKEGTYINVEIQVENNHDIDHRMLYYWAKSFSLQLVSGADYCELKDTICICIMNFNYFERDRYHSFYKVLETLDHEPLNNDMQLHFIELKKWAALKKKPNNRLERWLLYFANNDPKYLEEAASENKYIAGAIAAEVNFHLDSDDYYWYEMREKFLMDQGAIASRLAKFGNLESKLIEAESRLIEAEAKVASAEEKVASAEEKVASAEEKVASAEEKAASAEEKAASAEEKAASAEEKAASAEEKAAHANMRADKAEAELDKYRRLYEEALRKRDLHE